MSLWIEPSTDSDSDSDSMVIGRCASRRPCSAARPEVLKDAEPVVDDRAEMSTHLRAAGLVKARPIGWAVPELPGCWARSSWAK